MRTVSRLSRWLCALVLLPLWPMAGQKPGELYVSPLKNFSVAVPKFAFGTRVQKSNNRDGGLVVFIGGVRGREPVFFGRPIPLGLARQEPPSPLVAARDDLIMECPGHRAQGLGHEPPCRYRRGPTS